MGKRILIGVVVFAVLVASVCLIAHFLKVPYTKEVDSVIPSNALELAEKNYGEEVDRLAKSYEIPREYLLSLIVLECSGKLPAGTRFEKGVYDKLMEVRSGERRKFENIKPDHLKDATDQAIRNLATSWGPFQLMGYKCIGLEVNVADIRGERALENGVKWIDLEYGKSLRKEKFKDAFHYHNTGRKYPKVGKPRTHDPEYVPRGLEYMEFFKK